MDGLGIKKEFEGKAFFFILEKVRAELKAEGFGILSEIDVAAVLKEKNNEEIEPYVILGICQPKLASQALKLEPEVGLILPCNVVVYQKENRIVVLAARPQVLSDLFDLEKSESTFIEIAEEKINNVMNRLA